MNREKMRRLEKCLWVAVWMFGLYRPVLAVERDPLYQIREIGARNMGLGGAALASPGSLESVVSNPATLIFMAWPEIAGGFGCQSQAPVSEEYVLGSSPILGSVVVGAGLVKLNSAEEAVTAADSYLLSLAFPLSPNHQLVAGINAKFLHQNISDDSDPAAGGGVDLGLLYSAFSTPEGMSLQLGTTYLDAQTSIKNSSQEFRLPSVFGFGASFWLDPSRQFSLDFERQNSQGAPYESVTVLRCGYEQWFLLANNQALAGRAGYAKHLGKADFLSLGLGALFNDWQLDYALQLPVSGGGIFHQVSLSWGPQRGLPGKVRIETAETEKPAAAAPPNKSEEHTISALENAAMLEEKFSIKEDQPKPTPVPTPERAMSPSREEEREEAYAYNLPVPEGPAGQEHASLGVAPEMPAAFSSRFSGRKHDEFAIANQDLRLHVVVNPFSPNHDGRQDKTIFIGRLISERLRPAKWVLTISRGADVLQYFRGGSMLPRNLEWDGSNSKGKTLSDGDYTAVLRVLDENSMELASDTQTVTIRTQPRPVSLASPGTRVFTGGSKDKPVDFTIPDLPGSSSWQFTISNPAGQRAFQQSGNGRVPGKIEWNPHAQTRSLQQGDYGVQLVYLDDAGVKTKAQTSFRVQYAEFEVNLQAKPEVFKTKSQNGDGVIFQPELDGELKIKNWRLAILDEQEKTVMAFEGIGRPPASIAWDGKLGNGSSATPGSAYAGALTVVTALGAQNTVKTGKLQCDLGEYTGQKALAVNLVRVNFAEGSAEMAPAAKEPLLTAAKSLAGYKTDFQLEINGHCDKNESNALDLSRSRAQAVADCLVKEGKVSPEKIKTIGRGATQLLTPENSEEDRAKNRRAEVVLYAK